MQIHRIGAISYTNKAVLCYSSNIAIYSFSGLVAYILIAPDAHSQIAKFMGPIWGPLGSCRPQMGPMLAPWTLLSGLFGDALWLPALNRSLQRCNWNIPGEQSLDVIGISAYTTTYAPVFISFFNSCLILGLRPANERQRYFVTLNQSCNYFWWTRVIHLSSFCSVVSLALVK